MQKAKPRNGPRIRVSRAVGGDSPTQQNLRERVNINAIVARFKSTQEWNHINQRTPLYGNFDMGAELQEVIERVDDARIRFLELDADIRKLADNDPAIFLNMMADEDGRQILESAGLVIEGRTPPPAAQEAAEPATPTPPISPPTTPSPDTAPNTEAP